MGCTYELAQVRALYARLPANILGMSADSTHVKLYEQITQINTMVTAPSYKKNPVFEKRRGAAGSKGDAHSHTGGPSTSRHMMDGFHRPPAYAFANEHTNDPNPSNRSFAGGKPGGSPGHRQFSYHGACATDAHGPNPNPAPPPAPKGQKAAKASPGHPHERHATGTPGTAHSARQAYSSASSSYRYDGKRNYPSRRCAASASTASTASPHIYAERASSSRRTSDMKDEFPPFGESRHKPIVFQKPKVLTKSFTNTNVSPSTKPPVVGAAPAQPSDQTTAALENEIKIHMNKITMSTYDKLFGKVRDIVVDKESGCLNHALLRYVFRNTFECASMNASLIDIYVRLFQDVKDIDRDICSEMAQLHYDGYFATIDDIQSFNPQAEYDDYCKECKKNERRKNKSRFFCRLHKSGCLQPLFYHSLMKDVYMLLIRHIRHQASGHIVNEIADNLHILLLNCVDEGTRDVYARYFPEISHISKLSCQSETKHETYVSVTNKCVFKCRDIVEVYGT